MRTRDRVAVLAGIAWAAQQRPIDRGQLSASIGELRSQAAALELFEQIAPRLPARFVRAQATRLERATSASRWKLAEASTPAPLEPVRRDAVRQAGVVEAILRESLRRSSPASSGLAAERDAHAALEALEQSSSR